MILEAGFDETDRTLLFGVVAMIGCFGRKRETIRGVDPDQVGAMMTAAFVSFAMK